MKSIQARNFHKGRLSPIRLIVVHSMEIPEKGSTAEDCARMFATTTREASCHVCVDNNSAVRCVADKDTAWAAPGANADGLQMELAGFARQSQSEWLDEYGQELLHQAAKVAAGWAKTYKIPVRLLSRAELKAGKKGFTQHRDVSAVYKRSDHTDPGEHFPWDYFLGLVKDAMDGDFDDKREPEPTWTEELVKDLPILKEGDDNFDVKTLRWNLGARDVAPADQLDLMNTAFTSALTVQLKSFQKAKGLKDDGVCGPATWPKLLRL